jgi:predicted 3-demethylubiquinone-9 3-methyltransferase (glyoxalase superfamily)
MQKITTFLFFTGKQFGKCEEAMNFYTSLFKNSRIETISRYLPCENGPTGKIKHAVFTLNGQQFMAMESDGERPFSFNSAVSFFVTCEAEKEIDGLYANLSKEGSVLMELNKYPFSEKFGWVNDRYGVSWQLNLVTRTQKTLDDEIYAVHLEQT